MEHQHRPNSHHHQGLVIAAGPSSDLQQAPHQQGEAGHHQHRAEKTGFLAKGAEDEIGVLLRDKPQFGEGALHQAGAPDLPRADAHGALQQVVAAAEGILGGIKKQGEPGSLVGAQAVLPEPGGGDCEDPLHGKAYRQGHPLPGQALPCQPAHQGHPAQQQPGQGACHYRRHKRGEQQHHPGPRHSSPKQHHQQYGAKHKRAA